jgi:hypothetical protein
MKVRLTRKFSNLLNGIDLSHFQKGDTLELPARDAEMLLAEGWAEPAEMRDRASDRPSRSRKRRNLKARR